MIDDACQAARNAHKLVLIGVVLVMLFALSIRPDLYERAQRQINTALAIDWSDYDAFVNDRARVDERSLREPWVQMVRYAFGKTSDSAPLGELIERVRSVHEDTYGMEAERLEAVEVWMDVVPDVHCRWNDSPEAWRSRPEQITPLELLRFVGSAEGRRNARLFYLDRSAFEKAVWRELGSWIFDRHRGVPSVARVDEASFTAIARIEGDWGPAREWTDPVAPRAFWVNHENHEREFPLDVAEFVVEQTSVEAWLQSTHPELGEIVDGRLIPFAGLEEVWLTIADRPLGEAQLYLAAHAGVAHRRDRSVDVLGITVPGPLVPIAGPLVILAFILHLGRLVSHLCRLAPASTEELRAFAWPVLHAGRAWFADPLISLVFLPLAAQIAIAARLTEHQPGAVTVGWCVTMLSVLAGSVVLTRFATLRRLLTSA